MAKQSKYHHVTLTWEQKHDLVRKVDAYRKAHPKGSMSAAIIAIGDQLTESRYYAWRKHAEIEGLVKPRSRAKKAQAALDAEDPEVPLNGTEVTHFPVALLPAKPKPKPKPAVVKHAVELWSERDNKTEQMADFLESLARVLRR